MAITLRRETIINPNSRCKSIMISLTSKEVQRVILDAQSLRTESKCASILDVARRIHNIQVDTISVVARSHNLTAFNRFSGYGEGDVWIAQKRGELFEYWSHAMCLLPMESYSFYRWRMESVEKEKKGWLANWAAQNRNVVDAVFAHVKESGPSASKDFERASNRSQGWWDWKKEKYALEYLSGIGELMVAYREGFQKFYDLTERVLPNGVDTRPMPDDQLSDYVIRTVISSLGVASAQDIRTYVGKSPARKIWGIKKANIESQLIEEANSGRLIEVHIEGIKTRYFALSSVADHLDRFLDITGPVKFLSPFDNIMRERHFAHEIWGFEYKLEAYTPAEQRVHGYYVLPLLDNINLVGRVDAKVHRDMGLMELKSLFLEDDFWQNEEGLERLTEGTMQFASFHGAEKIQINSIEPKKAAQRIKAAIKEKAG